MESTKDLDYAIGWNRFNLRLLGIWPSAEDDEKNAGISRYRCILHTFFMLGFIVLPQSAYLFVIWGDLDLMTEDLATANMSTTVACMKIFVTWYHLETLKPLLSAFIEDWNKPKSVEERSVMLHNAKRARTISMLCTVMVLLLVTIYIFLRVVLITQMQRDQMEPDRTLICPAYFPYDVRKTPVFHLTCLGQILAAYSSSVSYSSVDSFISMLVLHVCAQITNLRIALKNLADRRSGKVRKTDDFIKELAAIVKRHEHLNRLVD
ncbi:hypothetical protein KPH14_004386 [Odynerus spinipes]|uniref:Odorant receptor n=1 Tax=Odynerus spinipes TaxID=1348599 RepID=A0AAD9RYN0_9HYME|nr:hypothetical protein KPH14_004386 [Odynerus spinipes]